MSRKFLIPALVFVVCMAFAGQAEARRHTFIRFSIDYPDTGWTELWDDTNDYQDVVIIRKNDYSALIIFEVKSRMGRDLEMVTKTISRERGGTAVRKNNSGGYYFEFNHRVGNENKLHRVDSWVRGTDFVFFTVHGHDPELKRIADSFRLLD